MNYRITVTEPAERDIRSNHNWWAQNRCEEEADRWLIGIDATIQSLRKMPERYGRADEPQLANQGVRQLSFGLGARPSHRVLYAVQGDQVVIYRVRAAAQDRLSGDALDG